MHPQSTRVAGRLRAELATIGAALLSTPDPVRFPLASPYAPDGKHLRPAVIYIRESERDQGVYSFETQYERAREILERYGFYVAMVRLDSKSGSKISRMGYQDIEQAGKSGRIDAVGVYMMARWGRRAKERLRIGEEFDRLGVDVYDAQRGVPDKPGLIRVVMAGVDEQYLRDLAQKAVDNMPRAAKAGKHIGPTPVGFKRVYPEGQEYDRHVSSVMVEHEIYGPIMRQLFIRYAEGWSTRKPTRWLNSLPDAPNPNSETGRWACNWVAAALRRRVYKQFEDTEFGEIEWGKLHTGDWQRYQGPMIHARGEHPWLCDTATWERVQLRLSGQARTRTVTQRGTAPALLHGFLRCPRCGAALTAYKACVSRGGRPGDYRCLGRCRATTDCREPGITMPVAEAAVLRELARLRGCPWEPQAVADVSPGDPHAERRRELQRALASEKAQLQRSVDMFAAVGDMSEPVVAAFRASSQATAERIQVLEASLAALPAGPHVDLDAARRIHEQLGQTEIRDALALHPDVGHLR